MTVEEIEKWIKDILGVLRKLVCKALKKRNKT